MKSAYLNSKQIAYTKKPAGIYFSWARRKLVFAIVLFSVFVSVFSGVTTFKGGPKEANADPVQFLACNFGPIAKMIYQYTQTSDLQFELFSKSRTGGSMEDVSAGFNGILDFVRTNGNTSSPASFKNINEQILGQHLDGSLKVDENSYKRWNAGPTVSPYDRFGISGMTFSSYNGEWRHLFIDACDDDEPSATETSVAPNTPGSGSLENIVVVQSNIVDSQKPNAIKRAADGIRGKMGSASPTIFGIQESRGATSESIGTQLGAGWKAYKKEGQTDVSDPAVAWDGSSYNLVNSGNFQIYSSGEGRPVENYNGSPRPDWTRWATWVTLSGNEGTFSVISVHGTLQQSAKAQTYQWGKLAELEKTLLGSGPVITVGDFNTFSAANKKILDDSQRNAGFTLGQNSNIDRMYYSTNDTTAGLGGVIDKGVTAGFGMDHPAVWGSFSAKGGSASSGPSTQGTTSGDPRDANINQYYDSRLEPLSTWEDIDRSPDVRTVQFSGSMIGHYFSALMVNAASLIFLVTKVIVSFAIALLGLAFADVPKLLGLTDLIVGTGSHNGLFQSLFNNFFQPMVWLAIIGTALWFLWTAAARRQFRAAFVGLFQVLLCFFFAVVISVSPGWFVSLPNNVAVIGSAVVSSTMNTGLTGGNGLCNTNVDQVLTGVDRAAAYNNISVLDSQKVMDRISLNLQSSAGCSYWYNLLLRPWAQAQFGDDYENLFGTKEGKCTPPANGKCLGADSTGSGSNRNYKWVGDPEVPLGGGQDREKASFVYNWALFQISTQTNAHSPIVELQKHGTTSAYSQGAAHDWWRVVDAMSNYDEVKVKVENCKNCQNLSFARSDSSNSNAAASDGSSDELYYSLPARPKPLKNWDTWAGNNPFERLFTVSSSVVIAILAVLAPLIFSALSVMYSIGTAFLMMVAPIFLLFGCWAGRGQQLFKAWLDLLINTAVKRIVLGVLTVVSMAFTSAALNVYSTVNWFEGIVLLAILSVVLIKFRHKILQAVAFSRMSTMDLGSTARNVVDKTKTMGSMGGQLASGAALGAVEAKRHGLDMKGGALAGFKSQFDNVKYRSLFTRSIDHGKKDVGGYQEIIGQTCSGLCDEKLYPGDVIVFIAGIGYMHEDCVPGDVNENRIEEIGSVYKKMPKTHSRSVYDDTHLKAAADFVDRKISTDFVANPSSEKEENNNEKFFSEVKAKVKEVILLSGAVVEEIEKYQYVKNSRLEAGMKDSEARVTPSIPEELRPYVDTDLINKAWQSENFEYLKIAYTAGWIEFAESRDPILSKHFEDSPNLKVEILDKVQNYSGEDWVLRV